MTDHPPTPTCLRSYWTPPFFTCSDAPLMVLAGQKQSFGRSAIFRGQFIHQTKLLVLFLQHQVLLLFQPRPTNLPNQMRWKITTVIVSNIRKYLLDIHITFQFFFILFFPKKIRQVTSSWTALWCKIHDSSPVGV